METPPDGTFFCMEDDDAPAEVIFPASIIATPCHFRARAVAASISLSLSLCVCVCVCVRGCVSVPARADPLVCVTLSLSLSA